MTSNKAVTLLLAEDDPDDRLLLRDAVEDQRLDAELMCVEDGEQLIDYLNQRGEFDSGNAPVPVLILMDLNMPKMGGREALTVIKSHPVFRSLPVVMLTTSSDRADVAESYRLGASGFIVKPSDYHALVRAVGSLADYWLSTVRLPQSVH